MTDEIEDAKLIDHRVIDQIDTMLKVQSQHIILLHNLALAAPDDSELALKTAEAICALSVVYGRTRQY